MTIKVSNFFAPKITGNPDAGTVCLHGVQGFKGDSFHPDDQNILSQPVKSKLQLQTSRLDVLTLRKLRLLLPKHKEAKFFENHPSPVMLVFK